MKGDLDPELKKLFAAEKDEPPPEETNKRLAGALATTLALPIPTAALTTATHLVPVAKAMVTAAKAWAMTGAAFVAGGAAVVVWTTTQTSPVPMPAVPQTVAPTVTPTTPSAPLSPEAQPVFSAEPLAHGDAEASPRLATARCDDWRHLRRAILARRCADRGERRRSCQSAAYPRPPRASVSPRAALGRTEALSIDALVHTREYVQAHARAERLRERSPNSLFLPVVDADLRSIP